MIEIKAGSTYIVAFSRYGTHEKRGPYLLARIDNDRNQYKESINVWASNPDERVGSGDTIEITDIEAVSHYQRKDERTGKWYTNVNITAHIQRINRPTDFNIGSPGQFDEYEGHLPF